MYSISEIKASLTEEQQAIINAVWEHRIRQESWHEWMPQEALYRKFAKPSESRRYGKDFVLKALSSLSGSILYQHSERGYGLTFLGILLTDDCQDGIDLLERYVKLLQAKYDSGLNLKEIKLSKQELGDALKLSEGQLRALRELIDFGRLGGVSGSNNQWEASMSFYMQELLEEDDIKGYIDQEAFKDYDPLLPVGHEERSTYLWQKQKAAPTTKFRVLAIDDEPQWNEEYLRLLSDILPTDESVLQTAASLAQAFEALKEHSYDIVIVDLLFEKEGSGQQSVRLLEQLLSRHPNLPVIVTSASLSPHAKITLSALGVSVIEKEAFIRRDDIRELIQTTIQKRKETEQQKSEPSEAYSAATQAFAFTPEVRHFLMEELDKYSSIKEKTIYLPEEGHFELIKPLVGFKRDIERQIMHYPFAENVFLMMKFRSSNKELSDYIIDNLAEHGLRGVRADANEWNITRNVYNPIAVLYCCKYGIALFDEPEEHQAYSANVAYELGIMHNQRKECLILRHSSLPSVPFDFIKDLYFPYERDLQVKAILDKWLRQIGVKK